MDTNVSVVVHLLIKCVFHTSSLKVSLRVVAGEYIAYRSLIPPTHTARAIVSTAAWKAATQTAKLFAQDGDVCLSTEPGAQPEGGILAVAATSSDVGSNVSRIAAHVE